MFIETILKISNFTENNIPDLSDKSAKDLRNVVKTYINFIYFIGTNDAVALPSRLFALKILPYIITYYEMIIHESNTSNKSNKKSIKRGGRSHQKGGALLKIKRGQVVMMVDQKNLIEGDIIYDDIILPDNVDNEVCDSVVVGAQTVDITNRTVAAQSVGGGTVFNNNSVTITRPGQQDQVQRYATENVQRYANVDEQRRNNQIAELVHVLNTVTLENEIDRKREESAITKERSAIRKGQAKNVVEQLSGTVTYRDYTNICGESFSAGMCCCIAIETRDQMVRNCASQTFETIVQTPYDLVSGTLGYVSGSIYNNTPSSFGDAGRMFYALGQSVNKNTGLLFKSLTPEHHNEIINTTLSNSTFPDATILHPNASEISCFQRVFDNYIDRTHNFLQSDSFMCCLIVSTTYCCCKYSRVSQRKAQIAETHTLGQNLTKFLDNRDNENYNNNISRITNVAGTILTIGGACAANPLVVQAGNTIRAATNTPEQQRQISNSVNQGPPNPNISDLLTNGQHQNQQVSNTPLPQGLNYGQLDLQQALNNSPLQAGLNQEPPIDNSTQDSIIEQGVRKRNIGNKGNKGGKPTKTKSKKTKKSKKSKKIRN